MTSFGPDQEMTFIIVNHIQISTTLEIIAV
jgi:hypothetical protein